MEHDQQIQQVPTAQGVRFVLPRRPAPHQIKLGLAMVLGCLIFIAVVLVLTRGLWYGPMSRFVQDGTVDLTTLLAFLPLLVLAGVGKGIRLGLLVAFGRGEVHVTKDIIIGIDRWGFLKSKRPARLNEITRLVVQPGVGARSDRKFKDDSWADGTNLFIEGPHENPNKQRVSLAMGYPSEMINALAEMVGLRIEKEPIHEDPVELERNASPEPPADTGVILEQPSKSIAVFVRTDDGLSITLPPRGFRKGSKGLGSFALLWCGFVAVMSAAVGASVLKGKSGGDDWIFFAFISVFWLIGLLMLYFAIRTGCKRAMIDVLEGSLLVTRQSIGKAKADEWELAGIEKIVVGPSGVEINNVPVQELQIWPIGSKKVGVLAERSDEELRWIASVLNREINALR